MKHEPIPVSARGHSAADDHSKRPSKIVKAVGKVTAALRADPDMKQVLDAFSGLNPKAIEKCSVEEARAQPTPADAVKHLLKKSGQDTNPEALVPGITTTERSVPGAAGSLPATIYTPEGKGPFPVIVYFHGGGWVIADRKVYDGGARGLAKAAQAIVISADYRRAPEEKFPAAHVDAIAVYTWACANAASFNGDPAHIALAGESAGGNLAVATAIAVRSLHIRQPCHILAIYPVAQTGSVNTASYLENALAQPLNRAMMEWFLAHALQSSAEKSDPRLNLVQADLSGLPATTIINAHLDPLRSDGSMLEKALERAGVQVLRQDYEGVTHEFFGMAAVVEKARAAQQLAGDRMRESFKR